MTAIAGLVHAGKAYIGGDSAGVAGMSLMVRADTKVFRKKGRLSARPIRVGHHRVTFPARRSSWQ